MDTVQLLHAPVRSRRDVFRVQQQARQLSRLLGLPLTAQMEVGCRAFGLATEALRERKKRGVSFHLHAGALRIGLSAGAKEAPEFRFSKPAPKTELSREDFVWVIAQVQVLLETEPFEVIQQQNEEVLLLLHALDCCRNELKHTRPFDEPSAA